MKDLDCKAFTLSYDDFGKIAEVNEKGKVVRKDSEISYLCAGYSVL